MKREVTPSLQISPNTGSYSEGMQTICAGTKCTIKEVQHQWEPAITPSQRSHNVADLLLHGSLCVQELKGFLLKLLHLDGPSRHLFTIFANFKS